MNLLLPYTKFYTKLIGKYKNLAYTQKVKIYSNSDKLASLKYKIL